MQHLRVSTGSGRWLKFVSVSFSETQGNRQDTASPFAFRLALTFGCGRERNVN